MRKPGVLDLLEIVMPNDLLDRHRQTLADAQNEMKGQLETSRDEFLLTFDAELSALVVHFISNITTFATEKIKDYVTKTTVETVKYIETTQRSENVFTERFEDRLQKFWGRIPESEEKKETPTKETKVKINMEEAERLKEALRDKASSEPMDSIRETLKELNEINDKGDPIQP